ncbi:MAG: hypothetical protein KBS41_04405 [Oscillospiraceae bacterium]|nr:hypothetical protein [Candidatus Equicaccousia limihippi]
MKKSLKIILTSAAVVLAVMGFVLFPSNRLVRSIFLLVAIGLLAAVLIYERRK